MTIYQWATLGLGALGFLITWFLGAFKLGRAVELMKADIKKDVEAERVRVVELIRELEDKFYAERKVQDHNFGEVGLAMRQYTADVEKQVRELEIWGRDNFVQRGEFERSFDAVRQDIKEMARSIKEDFREVFAKIDGSKSGPY